MKSEIWAYAKGSLPETIEWGSAISHIITSSGPFVQKFAPAGATYCSLQPFAYDSVIANVRVAVIL
jgi:hypothetical protein